MYQCKNQYFVAIRRCAQKILLAYSHICGAAIFFARLVWLRTIDFQEGCNA